MLCKTNQVVKQQAFVYSAVPQTLPPFTYFFLKVKFPFFFVSNVSKPTFSEIIGNSKAFFLSLQSF